MKNSRHFLRALSLILAMATVFLSVSFTVVAEDSTVINQNEIITDVTEEVSFGNPDEFIPAVFEVEDLREENVKHFSLPDGTYQAVSYGGAVHRQNEDGTWRDIDNRLFDSRNEYTTEDGRISFARSTLSLNGEALLYTLTEDNYMIAMGIVGTSSFGDITADDNAVLISSAAVTNHAPKPEILATDSAEEQLSKLRDIDNTTEIVYEDILSGTDIEYVLTGNDIKENIIVKSKRDSYTYTFVMIVKGLIAAENGDGSITLSDEMSGEAVYYIPAPYMYDAAGEISYAVSYTLEEDEQNIYTLAVTADETWINEDDRAFPVVIDPYIEVFLSQDTYVSSAYPNNNYHAQMNLDVGTRTTALMKLDFPTLPEGAVMDSARLYVPYFYSISTGDLSAGIYRILGSWDHTTVTYNTLPSISSSCLSTAWFYADAYTTASTPGWTHFDISASVKDLYNPDGTVGTNYGYAIKRTGGTNGNVLLKSKDCQFYPSMDIVYNYLPEGAYSIRCTDVSGNNKYLYVQSDRTTATNSLVTRDTLVSYNNSEHGRYIWDIKYVGAGYCIITSMAVRDDSTISATMVITAQSNSSVVLQKYTGSSAQKWKISFTSDGRIIFTNRLYSTKCLSYSNSGWLTSSTYTPLYFESAVFRECIHNGNNTCGIDENGEVHVQVLVDSSLYEGGFITYDMLDAFSVWEEASDNRVHIYMPGESCPTNVFIVTVKGTHENYDYAGLTICDPEQDFAQDLNWNKAIIKMNLDEFARWTNTTERALYIKKVLVHEMGHVLRLDEIPKVGSPTARKEQNILSVMRQGRYKSLGDIMNESISEYCVCHPTSYDIWNLKQKWGW